MGVLHTAIRVADLEAAETFFVEGLGMTRDREIVGGDGVRNVFVAGAAGAPIQLRGIEPGADEPTGLDHLAVETDDAVGVADRLVEEFDAAVLRGPSMHGDDRVVFVRGIDGYVVELVESDAAD